MSTVTPEMKEAAQASLTKADTLLDMAYTHLGSLRGYVANMLDDPVPHASDLKDASGADGMMAAITVAVERHLEHIFLLIIDEIQVHPGPEITVKLQTKCLAWLVSDLNCCLPRGWSAGLTDKGRALVLSCLTDVSVVQAPCTALHADKLCRSVQSITATLITLQEAHYAQERKKVQEAFLWLKASDHLKVTVPVHNPWPQWFAESLPHCSASFHMVNGAGAMVVQYTG